MTIKISPKSKGRAFPWSINDDNNVEKNDERYHRWVATTMRRGLAVRRETTA